MVSAQIIVITK